MEFFIPGGKQEPPSVLRTLILKYFRSPETPNAYQWYLDLLKDIKLTGELRKLYLIPLEKLLEYLDLLLTDHHQEIVASILDHYPEKDRESLLSEAAYGGHAKVVKYLLTNGAHNLRRARWKAARGGHLKLAKYLSSQGDHSSLDALSGAAAGGHLELVKFFSTKVSRISHRTFRHAAKGGHLGVVEYLLSREDLCPFYRETYLQDALLGASKGGQLDMVKYLITRGAIYLNKALQVAVDSGNSEIVDYLVEQGAIQLNGALPTIQEGK